MRFWQKIFISMLILFMVIFDIGAYILVSYSYNFNLKRETDNALREQSVISSLIVNYLKFDEILYNRESTDKSRIFTVVSPLIGYYEAQDISLALYLEDEEVFTNIPEINNELLIPEEYDVKKILNKSIDGKRYLFISSRLSNYPNLILIYARDISVLNVYKESIGRVFIILGTSICIILAVSIFLLLKRLTYPLSELSKVTGEIAKGAYGQRVNIKNNDEFGEVGNAFNLMAVSIEEKMSELVKHDKDKQYFIDSLAHEIKTPLTSVLGYSEYLQNAKASEEERIIAAGHLHNAAKRIKKLQSALLEMTYLRTTGINNKEVDIPEVIELLTESIKPVLDEYLLELVTVIEARTVLGDGMLILSLLINLVENAARASKPYGKIIIRTYREAFVIIEVTDYGCGMKEDEVEKVTEPFYRVDKSRSRILGGVGLGLSLCRQIVELHGAELEIKSKLNQGTVVRIIFTT